jgi:hypothetical protein
MERGRVDPSQSFIDILHLGQPELTFFTEPLRDGPDKGKNLMQAVADQVNAMSPSATPVVRFLVGNPDPPGPRCPDAFKDVFWPDGKQVFKHPNAQLYVGTFNPNAK